MIDEQTITVAYESLMNSAATLFTAGEETIKAKDMLETSRLALLFNGTIIGKNADEREASARLVLKAHYEALAQSQEHERLARYEFDQEQRNVDMTRALLRLMEITAVK